MIPPETTGKNRPLGTQAAPVCEGGVLDQPSVEPKPFKVVPMSHGKGASSTNWNAEQCLEELLVDIRSGKVKPVNFMIMWFEDTDDGRMKPRRWFVNVSPKDEVALTALAHHMAIEDWRDR